MAVYNETLYSMRGEVRQAKANASTETIDSALNRRLRQLFDRYSWSDSLKTGVININQSYSTGTVNMNPNSNLVTGVGTNWPINDLLSATIAEGVIDPGFRSVTPSGGSMAIIKPGMYILIDPGNPPFTEVVQVRDVSSTKFIAQFTQQHNAGCAISISSLAGRQLQAQFPTFTVVAVISPTSLQIDQNWQGMQPGTGLGYNIFDGYLSVTPQTRRLMLAWDPIASNPIDIWHTQDDLAIQDPQRTNSDNPLWLAQMPPGGTGIAQWELWPYQFSPYQLSVVSCEQWPKMKQDNDSPPYFINPEILIAGARADVLRIKNLARGDRQDPYYDPALAKDYEGMFEEMFEGAIQSDQGRQNTFLSNWMKDYTGDVNWNWAINHAVYQGGGGQLWP